MYDNPNDPYSDWHTSMQQFISAAAATELAVGPPQGEIWRVLVVAAYHNDPAPHDCAWRLRQGAVTVDFMNAVAHSASGFTRMYGQLNISEPLILRYGDLIIFGSTALAAGKVFTMNICTQIKRGVTS